MAEKAINKKKYMTHHIVSVDTKGLAFYAVFMQDSLALHCAFYLDWQKNILNLYIIK